MGDSVVIVLDSDDSRDANDTSIALSVPEFDSPVINSNDIDINSFQYVCDMFEEVQPSVEQLVFYAENRKESSNNCNQLRFSGKEMPLDDCNVHVNEQEQEENLNAFLERNIGGNEEMPRSWVERILLYHAVSTVKLILCYFFQARFSVRFVFP